MISCVRDAAAAGKFHPDELRVDLLVRLDDNNLNLDLAIPRSRAAAICRTKRQRQDEQTPSSSHSRAGATRKQREQICSVDSTPSPTPYVRAK